MALTKTEVKRAVRQIGREAKRSKNDINDTVYEMVDDWWSATLKTGRIDQLSDVPEDRSDVDNLMSAIVILQTALEEGWGIADDSGLWQGLAPYPALMSQAYFTLEQGVQSELG